MVSGSVGGTRSSKLAASRDIFAHKNYKSEWIRKCKLHFIRCLQPHLRLTLSPRLARRRRRHDNCDSAVVTSSSSSRLPLPPLASPLHPPGRAHHPLAPTCASPLRQPQSRPLAHTRYRHGSSHLAPRQRRRDNRAVVIAASSLALALPSPTLTHVRLAVATTTTTTT